MNAAERSAAQLMIRHGRGASLSPQARKGLREYANKVRKELDGPRTREAPIFIDGKDGNGNRWTPVHYFQ